MTPENKERIVKYWNIVSDKQLVNFEGVAEVLNEFYNSDYLIAIQCSIAEVEAIIKALEEYDSVTEAELNIMPHQTQNMEADFRHYGKQLAELKKLLV